MIPSTVLWHYTSRQTAEEIIRNGFRDGTGPYLTGDIYSGVWLSDVPLDARRRSSARAGDDCVYLRVTLPYRLEDLADYEWVEDMVADPDTGERLHETLSRMAGPGRDDRREDAQKRNASVYVFMSEA